MKVYIAGPLFTEGEILQRKVEGKKVRELLESKNIPSMGVFNPIEAPFNDKASARPTSEDIFNGDYTRLEKADALFFDIANEDSGTIMELGIVLQNYLKDKKQKIYVVSSDIRFGGEIDQGHRAQIGHNQFVIGGILTAGLTIHKTFDEALAEFEKTLIK